jgi:hypothetical protein
VATARAFVRARCIWSSVSEIPPARLPRAAQWGWRRHLVAHPRLNSWHQSHEAMQEGRNLRAADGAPEVRVCHTPEKSARDAQGVGKTETRGIFGVRAYPLPVAPSRGGLSR